MMLNNVRGEDATVVYLPHLREHALPVPDGTPSAIIIVYCPWCGKKLPSSLREEWFDRLDALGLSPASADIPKTLLTEKWWAHTRRKGNG